MGRVRTPHADEGNLVNGHAHAKEEDQIKVLTPPKVFQLEPCQPAFQQNTRE